MLVVYSMSAYRVGEALHSSVTILLWFWCCSKSTLLLYPNFHQGRLAYPIYISDRYSSSETWMAFGSAHRQAGDRWVIFIIINLENVCDEPFTVYCFLVNQTFFLNLFPRYSLAAKMSLQNQLLMKDFDIVSNFGFLSITSCLLVLTADFIHMIWIVNRYFVCK